MTDPFIAEIRMFGGNFAPRGWAFCDGQVISIAQNTALFSLVGTTYGGNGQTNFALPNLQGRAPMHWGSGPGLAQRNIGQTGGTETVTLAQNQMPFHTHTLYGDSGTPSTDVPSNTGYPGTPDWVLPYQSSANNLVDMANQALVPVGGNQPHNNMQPYLAVNFIIALEGIYPARS